MRKASQVWLQDAEEAFRYIKNKGTGMAAENGPERRN